MRHIVKIFNEDPSNRYTLNRPHAIREGDLVEIHNMNGSVDLLCVRKGTCYDGCCLSQNGRCIRRLDKVERVWRCILHRKIFVSIDEVMEDL